MAISNRLNRLRRKAAEEGLVPKGGAVASAKSRKGDGASTKGKEGMKGGLTAEGPESERFLLEHFFLVDIQCLFKDYN